MSKAPTFIPLKVHSAFSLAEGMLHIESIIDLCEMHNIPAVGLTDSGNLFGAYQFSQKAIKKGVQPILGCILPILKPEKNLQVSQQRHAFPMTFYAKNEEGYRNLVKLSSHYYKEIAFNKASGLEPTVLSDHKAGIIAFSGGKRGLFQYYIRHNQMEEAKALLTQYQDLYKDDFYIEISRQTPLFSADEEKIALDLAYELGIPIIATHETFFKSVHDVEAHDALLCVSDGTYVMEDNRRHSHPDYAFFSPEQIQEMYQDIPEALQNTIRVAKSCGFAVQSHAPIFPQFETTLGQEEELRKQAEEGLEVRLKTQVFQAEMSEEAKNALRAKYQERLHFELEIIIKMGFAGYFLIVADFIKWAKARQIPVGPGRGSGAGSVVAWALTITDPDPIRFSLLFERFLNPERVSMPDFDIDFCQDRRDEVIDYVRQKYGEESVAQIITFGKLQARAVIRDVGRVLQMPYAKVDRISKMIPHNPTNPITLSEAIAQDAELRRLRDTDESVKKLLEIALKLEGLYRHASTHAAGVVIAGCPLQEIVAIYYDPKSALPATQFNMKDVESVGLLKFDFLGLKTLTVLQETINLLAKRNIIIDLDQIPLDDTLTFEMLQRMETVGVFQLEGAGMREALGRIKPDRIEDIIALVSLYRPGPMDNIPRYIACKHGLEQPDYLHPMLEGILKETFGVMIYQEQVMEIAQVLSGYSLGAADLLRRAMGKKIKEEMDQQRQIFVEGAAKNNVSPEKASLIFDQVAKFAGYGFNKSHATAYAIIAYQTAYLKANYPVEFMAATMTHDMHNTDKLFIHRQELQRMGIPLLSPDVNTSDVVFTVGHTPQGTACVHYALAAIKNVGSAAMQAVVAERQTNGLFASIEDFFARIGSKEANRRQIESLIFAGAFDSLDPNRRKLHENLDAFLNYNQRVTMERGSSQNHLFGQKQAFAPTLSLSHVDEWALFEKLQKEMEALGFYLSDHPLSPFQHEFARLKISSYQHMKNVLEQRLEGNFLLCGVLLSTQERTSKTGNKFAFLQFSDLTGNFEVVIFSELYFQVRDQLATGQMFILDVAAKLDEEQLRINTHTIKPLDHVLSSLEKSLDLKVKSPNEIKELGSLLQKAPQGTTKIRIYCDNESYSTTIELPEAYHIDTKLLYALQPWRCYH